MINFYYIKKFKVTKKGKVTAVKAGKAKVTVTEKSKKKKRKIGVVMVKVKAKKAVEISQSENHTAAGGNPGGCLFLGGDCGLRDEIYQLGQGASPSCVV